MATTNRNIYAKRKGTRTLRCDIKRLRYYFKSSSNFYIYLQKQDRKLMWLNVLATSMMKVKYILTSLAKLMKRTCIS